MRKALADHLLIDAIALAHTFSHERAGQIVFVPDQNRPSRENRGRGRMTLLFGQSSPTTM